MERKSGLSVILGVDRLLESPEEALAHFEKSPRIGLLTNDSARVGIHPPIGHPNGPSRIAMQQAGLKLRRIFTPEHGLSASAPDGVAIPDSTDGKTKLPVVSLYGADLHPPDETLKDLDLIMVDLQDVGARFYTYLWTLSHVLAACSRARLPILVLDRPNPLGGKREWVEGPLPDPGAPPTFLGRWPIPVRHSLTLGEMALLLRAEMGLDVELEVVAMAGWKRHQLWLDTGLPFHPPSPGIPSFRSALLYPGTALLEATNVYEGRGSDLAFQWFGAPWMDGRAVAEALNETEPPGVRAHAHPREIPDHPGPCPGVVLEVRNPKRVRPVALGLSLLSLLSGSWPDRFMWTPYPTAVNPDGEGHLFRLLARTDVVEALERMPESIGPDTIEGWTGAPGWWDRALPHLLYE